ncbi:MAG TPA: hypothetical protein VFV10_07500, partial [Gammaproteobacteria bacterium]|nr:hypothetical protein [Gammaproteobacteria bacterium]
LSPDALVEVSNRGTDEAIAAARASAARIAKTRPSEERVDLDAQIRVVHGRETVASTEGTSFEQACADFARFIGRLEKEGGMQRAGASLP